MTKKLMITISHSEPKEISLAAVQGYVIFLLIDVISREDSIYSTTTVIGLTIHIEQEIW